MPVIRLVRCLKFGAKSKQLCTNNCSGIEHVQTNFPVRFLALQAHLPGCLTFCRLAYLADSPAWLNLLLDWLSCLTTSPAWLTLLLDWLSCLTDSVAWLTHLLDLLTCLTDYPAWLSLFLDWLSRLTDSVAWLAHLLDLLTCLTGSPARLARTPFMTDRSAMRGHLTRSEPGDPLAWQFYMLFKYNTNYLSKLHIYEYICKYSIWKHSLQ